MGGPIDQVNLRLGDLMRRIRDEIQGPIIFFGDFNEIPSANEKEGGNSRAERDMDAFRSCLDDYIWCH